MKTRIYSSKSIIANPLYLLKDIVSDIISSRGIAWRLFLRNLKTGYRQSFLGFFWSFIFPLVTTVTWVFLNDSGIVKVADTSLPYPMYVMFGTFLWQSFVNSLESPINMTKNNSSLITKINFPKEALILAGLGQIIYDFLISLCLMFIAYFWFQYCPTISILFVPIGVFALLLLGTTIGLLLAPIGLIYTDIGKAIQLVTRFWFFITPIVFSMPESGITRLIMQWNPVTPILVITRDWLTSGETDQLIPFIIIFSITFIIFLLSLFLYRLSMPYIIERAGS